MEKFEIFVSKRLGNMSIDSAGYKLTGQRCSI